MLEAARTLAVAHLEEAIKTHHQVGYRELLAAAYAGIAAAYWAIAAGVAMDQTLTENLPHANSRAEALRQNNLPMASGIATGRCNQACTYQLNDTNQAYPEYCGRPCICQRWGDHSIHRCAMHAGYLPALQQTKHFVNPYPFGIPSIIYQSDHSLNGDFASIQPIRGQEVWHEPQEDNVQQQEDEQIDTFLDARGVKRPQSGEALGEAYLLEFNSAHNEAVMEYMAGISHHESTSPTLFNPRRLKDGADGVS